MNTNDSMIATDLTDVDRRQQELDAEVVKFLLAASAEFIVEHDVQGRILEISPSAAKALGYEREDLIAMAVDQVAEPDYLAALEQCFATDSGEEVAYVEGTLKRRDGGKFFVHGMARTLGHADLRRVVVSIRPLERRSRAGQITQAQKLEAIGQLAAGIAHEINTPTQYVGDNVRFLQDAFESVTKVQALLLGLVDTLEAQGLLVEQVAEARKLLKDLDFEYVASEIPLAITQTLEGVEQIARIVRAMKEFSHPDREEKTLVQLNNAVESTVTVARNEWKYVADVVRDLDPNLPMVPCLAGEFNQVLLNLLVNASHAIADALGDSGEKGTITISTKKVDDWVEIRVGDTGGGIPEYARSRIFDPFFTTKEVGKGTGQGLSLAYTSIVEKHGGLITFETELGKGTTFVIRLPLAGSL